MSYWKKVIARDSSVYNENLEGYLLLIGERNLIKDKFKYASITSRKYTSVLSSLPGEFIEPSETIYTTDIDKPFTKGSSIVLCDKSTMTIKDIENVLNKDTGRLKAYILTLSGGVPNEFN